MHMTTNNSNRPWIRPAIQLLTRPWLPCVSISDVRFKWFTKGFPITAYGHVHNLEDLVDLVSISDDVVESIGILKVVDLLDRLDEYGEYVLQMPLDDELFSILASVTEAQHVEELLSQFGWSTRQSADPPLVDDSHGERTDIPRFDSAAILAKDTLREQRYWTPALDRALDLITLLTPDIDSVGSQLQAAGIAESDCFDARSLRLACELLGKPIPPALVPFDHQQQTQADQVELLRADLAQAPQEQLSILGAHDEISLETAESMPQSALGRVAAWAAMEHQASTIGDVLNLIATLSTLPSDIESFWASWTESDATVIGAEFIPQYDAIASFRAIHAHLTQKWGADGPHAHTETARRWRIVTQRLTATTKPATLQELGEELGITRERVRQLETKLREGLQVSMSAPCARAFVRSARQLRRRSGVAFPIEELDRKLTLRFDLDPDTIPFKQTIEQLLLWVAGPFREMVPGWLVCEEASNLPQLTLARLHEATQEGPIAKDDAITMVTGLGVLRPYAERWIEQVGRFKMHDELLVRWSGAFADKAEQILMLAGEPLTREEIVTRVGERVSRGPVQMLLADPRFTRTTRNHIGLRAWGLEEYSTIEEEIAQEIDRQGGEASSDHLVTTLARSFHVAESSVRQYLANSPNFSRTVDGLYVNQSRSFKPRISRPVELSRGCFRVDNHWSIKMRVTTELLRGSGTGISTPFAAYLGARIPGSKVQLFSPVGPVTIANTPTGSTISSLRAAANSLSVHEGDLLFVCFCEDDRLDFRSISKTALDGAEGLTKLAYEIGVTGVNEEQMISSIAYAIGLDDDATTDQIRRRFVERREPELAELLHDVLNPEEENSKYQIEDDTIGDLLRLI